MGYRYIGAKTRLLNKIIAEIVKITPKNGHVADLMCGTAAVSFALRRCGFQVTAADIMTYSYHHARVALLLNSPPTFEGASEFIDTFSGASQASLLERAPYDKMIDALNNLPPQEGYFWREFSLDGAPRGTENARNYFSPPNAKKIDGLRFWIKALRERGDITDLEHSLLLHDLIMAANDVANISGTYGHYLSKLIGRAESPIKLKATPFDYSVNSVAHRVLQGYAEDLASDIICDTCYVDPPYMKRQYAANYHILETLAREDEPEAVGVSGLRPWRDQYSNFCTKTRIRSSFRKVLSRMNCAEFLISYSEDGLLQLDELLSLFSEFGKTEVIEFGHRRFRSNDSKLEPLLMEYVIRLQVN